MYQNSCNWPPVKTVNYSVELDRVRPDCERGQLRAQREISTARSHDSKGEAGGAEESLKKFLSVLSPK